MSSQSDPESELLLEGAWQRDRARLSGRERQGQLVAAIGFVLAAGATAVLLPWPRELDVPLALVLVCAHALACRVRFWVGAGSTVPTQLVLVPMLFVLPTPLVPALVALGQILSDVPDIARGRRHVERAAFSIGDSWYALTPALILSLTGATPFEADLWPVYLIALVGQFATELLVNALRDWFELGVTPRRQLVDGAWICCVDALLAPAGLLAAAAATIQPWLALLVVPQIVLLEVFAREREQRLNHSLELRSAYQGTSSLLAELLQEDDEYTGVHSRDVVQLSVAVAGELGLDAGRVRDTEFAALLHDIGKIAVPKTILNKPGKLTAGEWEVMRGHTVEGQRMLDRVGGALSRVGVLVRASHERWDGGGYPDGLRGSEIPVESRIVCACDAFDAITTDRPYRKALPLEVARQELRECAGTQFDPDVVAALLRVVERPARRPEPALELAS